MTEDEKKDLIEYLGARIVYYNNQNVVLDNKERQTTHDYHWIKHNQHMISQLSNWITKLERLK